MAKKVLIVDNEKDDLESMEKILENGGYKVEAGSNWERALEKISENAFDLVLLDILIPETSGYELLRLMKKKSGHKTKFAYVSIVPKQDVDLKEVDCFIQKPFGNEDFLVAVKSLLK